MAEMGRHSGQRSAAAQWASWSVLQWLALRTDPIPIHASTFNCSCCGHVGSMGCTAAAIVGPWAASRWRGRGAAGSAAAMAHHCHRSSAAHRCRTSLLCALVSHLRALHYHDAGVGGVDVVAGRAASQPASHADPTRSPLTRSVGSSPRRTDEGKKRGAEKQTNMGRDEHIESTRTASVRCARERRLRFDSVLVGRISVSPMDGLRTRLLSRAICNHSRGGPS